jgi:hypothetical protein
MQSATWKQLLQTIPVKRHHNLMVVTKGGTEITLQAVLRMEEEYLVLRGRLAGTSNAGHIFFVPYEQLDHICSIVEIREEEIEAIFGSPGAVFTAAMPGVASTPTQSDKTLEEQAAESAEFLEGAGEEQPDVEEIPEGHPHPTPERGIRSMELLERLRSRTNSKHPPGKGKK